MINGLTSQGMHAKIHECAGHPLRARRRPAIACPTIIHSWCSCECENCGWLCLVVLFGSLVGWSRTRQYSLELWQEILGDFIDAKSREASEPWVIMGNSLGGLLTLMLTEQLQEGKKASELVVCRPLPPLVIEVC